MNIPLRFGLGGYFPPKNDLYPHLDLKLNNNSQRVQGSVIRWLEIQHTSYEIINGIWSQWFVDYGI
jgi:hypothetical protein